MADSNFIDGLKTELWKLNDPELTALRNDVNELKARPVAPSPKAYITETWRSGVNWWRKYSDGFIEQGGFVLGTRSWTVRNLHKAFSSNNYTILCSMAGQNSSDVFYSTPGVIKPNNNYSFKSALYGSNADEKIFWYACGY